MLTIIAPIRSLLAGVALLLIGNGLLNTLLTLRGAAEGFSSSLLGLLMSGYFLGFLLGTWLAVPLILRIGHIRTFAFCAAICACAVLMHILIINPWVWFFLRLVYGMALITLYLVIENWLNAQTSSDQRGQVFATYMVVNLAALALGQQLLNLASPQTFTLFALASILICSALMPITLTYQTQPTLPEKPKTNLRMLFHVAPLPVAAAGFSGLVLGAFWGMAPVYASLSGFDSDGIAMLMSVTIIGGALLQWPIGRFSDKHDRLKVMLSITLLAIALSLAMFWLKAGPLLLGILFFWGGLLFCLYPIAVVQMVDQMHPDEILAGSTGLLLVNGFGSALGPVLAGVLMEYFGAPALALFFAVSLTALAGFIVYRQRRVSDLHQAPLGHFAPMLRTSHTVLELMPDAPEQAAAQADEQNPDAADGTANPV
jgi:MFS family permease